MDLNDLLLDIYRNSSLPKARERRGSLIERMAEDASKGLDCRNCQGLCCTFTSNSMQTTAIEALEIYHYLVQQKRLDLNLLAQLQECVDTYRLDKDLGDGRRSFRRTYTCPFYAPGAEGCQLSQGIKPYGCLAFNPNRPGCQGEGGCSSDQGLLEQLDLAYQESESQANKLIIEKLGLYWQRLPMPLALLELHKKLA